ncbi:MAG TPA: hypothetical protein VEB40_01050, partial [Flavipsychrobacter sp.]|nr:hypothetical protein [Flavipsychrobacter sp.]
RKKHPGHPYKDSCVCARCKRVRLKSSAESLNRAQVINNYLQSLPDDTAVIRFEETTLDAMIKQRHELKYLCPADDKNTFIHKLVNLAITKFCESL